MINQHNKLKNTGILFELITRQITADIMNGIDNSKAIPILKKYFKEGTELNKELQLYHCLSKSKAKAKDKADDLIKITMESRSKLNNQTLKKQRYDLIKEIKDNYNLTDFLQAKITNYKPLASIYMIFEHAVGNANPVNVLSSKATIIEAITAQKPTKVENDDVFEKYEKMDEDLRLLTYKIMLDNFNNQYKSLNNKQKQLLREYINNVSDTPQFKEYFLKEVQYVKNIMSKMSSTITDNVFKLKLKESINLLDKKYTKKTNTINDTDLHILMNYYQLIDEVKNAK